jgi:hypothetical protein
VLWSGRISRFPLAHVQCAPSILVKTIASDPAITTRVSTTVLSETYAQWARPVAHSGYPRGTMVRRVPRR